MTYLANILETRLTFAPQGLSGASEVEPVIVTPGRSGPEFGSAGIRDRVFAAHCEFACRRERVSAPAGDGIRTLVFYRFRQTASFERAALHDQFPNLGDRVTRTWDGVTFEITAIYVQAGSILCDLAETKSHLQ